MKKIATFGALLALLASTTLAAAAPHPSCGQSTTTGPGGSGTIVLSALELANSGPTCRPNGPRPPVPGTIVVA